MATSPDVEAIRAIEEVLRDAAAEEGAGWQDRVGRGLDKVQLLLDEHHHTAEDHQALVEEIRAAAPRLVPRAESVIEEHRRLVAAVEELVARRETGDDIRDQLAELADRLARHRYLEGELLLDAYEVDVATGD